MLRLSEATDLKSELIVLGQKIIPSFRTPEPSASAEDIDAAVETVVAHIRVSDPAERWLLLLDDVPTTIAELEKAITI